MRPSDRWLEKLVVIKTNARFMDNLEIFRSGDSGLLPMEVYFWTISMEIWEPHSSQGMKFLNYITMRNKKKRCRENVSLSEQDKVNYAVSEREDRVTDLTTLTRKTGCTGIYWAATGLC